MTEKRKPIRSKASPPLNTKLAANVSAGVASDDSRTISGSGVKADEDLLSINSVFQLTARTRVELTRRQRSLLLEVLEYQGVHWGVNFGQWLMIEMLYSSLIGGKSDWRDLKDQNERRVCGLAHMVLGSLKNDYLYIHELRVLDSEVRDRILSSGLLMDSRTYGSRYASWCPENFLEVKAVLVETLVEREGSSSRYSSYTKGYGESHPSTHRQKTKPSTELDGEDSDRPVSFTWQGLIELLHLNEIDLLRIGLKGKNR